jgi:D-threo-aldose 1-dehydrogenase
MGRDEHVRVTDGVPDSTIGLGGAQFGNLYEVTTDEKVAATVAAAWARGVRYFDTAPHYGLGLSERRLGAALRSLPRDEFAVSTKVGRLLMPSPETADRQDDEGFVVPAAWRRVRDYSRDGVLRSIEASLTRTGLDRFDIVYLHDPDDHWEQASTSGVETLIELRDQGVVRAIGAGMNQSAMLAEFVRRTDIDIVMVAGRYTLLDQSAADDLLPLALERRVAVVAAGVYNSGLLSTDRIGDEAKFDYADAPPHVIERTRQLAAVCEAHGVTVPAAALAFPLLHPAVRTAVVGVGTAGQVEETFRRLDTPVPSELWADLAAHGLLSRLPLIPEGMR